MIQFQQYFSTSTIINEKKYNARSIESEGINYWCLLEGLIRPVPYHILLYSMTVKELNRDQWN